MIAHYHVCCQSMLSPAAIVDMAGALARIRAHGTAAANEDMVMPLTRDEGAPAATDNG